MTDQDLARSLRQFYALTGAFSLIGFVACYSLRGSREAFAFLLGAAGSFGTLWLFTWMSHAIAPGTRPHRPWRAGLFIARYVGLFLVVYATVNALDVSPLPVLLGLLASTAAVLASSIVDLARGLRGNRSSH